MDIANDAMAIKAESHHNEHPSQEASAAPAIPHVVWYKHKGLRRLYAMMPILFLGQAYPLVMLCVVGLTKLIQARQSMDMMALSLTGCRR
jgi:hypothetical protein